MIARIGTNVGLMEIDASDRGIQSIRLVKRGKLIAPSNPVLRRCVQQIQEYVRRERQEFDLPLDIHGTPFQRTVWHELARIPYGETVTYGHLAATIGKPAASRAVGQAVGRNPVCIVVPCHRVISSVGLGGYAYGVASKKRLLALEKKIGSPAEELVR